VLFIASGNGIPNQVITQDSFPVIDDATNCLGDTIELRLDGDNDYVQIPHDPVYDFGTDQDFTLECRVRTTEAADVSIIGNKDWDSGNNKGFGMDPIVLISTLLAQYQTTNGAPSVYPSTETA